MIDSPAMLLSFIEKLDRHILKLLLPSSLYVEISQL